MKGSKSQSKTWRNVKLGNYLSEVISGGRPKGGTLTVFDGIPSIGAEHLDGNGCFDFSNLKYVPEDYYQNSNHGKIKKGDILAVKDGATIGKVSQINKTFPFKNAMVNEHVFIIRANSDILNQKFLFYKLITHEGIATIKNSIGGSAQGGLKKDFLDYWAVNIPEDVNEQKRIAEILSAFDDKIELNNKISQNLEQMAQAIFKEWFVNFKFPGYKKVKMVNSEMGKIPEGWEIGRLGELMVLRKGKFKDYEEWRDLKLLDLGRFPQKSLAITSYGKGEEIKTSGTKFCKKDILFGAVRPYFHKVVIAPFDGVTNSSVFVIRPKRKDWYNFLITILFSENTVNYASMSASGTKMPVIKWRDFCDMEILMPEERIVNMFEDSTGPFYNIIIKNVEENQKLASLRDLLLPKLMSGEIRVKV